MATNSFMEQRRIAEQLLEGLRQEAIAKANEFNGKIASIRSQLPAVKSSGDTATAQSLYDQAKSLQTEITGYMSALIARANAVSGAGLRPQNAAAPLTMVSLSARNLVNEAAGALNEAKKVADERAKADAELKRQLDIQTKYQEEYAEKQLDKSIAEAREFELLQKRTLALTEGDQGVGYRGLLARPDGYGTSNVLPASVKNYNAALMAPKETANGGLWDAFMKAIRSLFVPDQK